MNYTVSSKNQIECTLIQTVRYACGYLIVELSNVQRVLIILKESSRELRRLSKYFRAGSNDSGGWTWS
ncbi:hypothetical protein RJ641_013850 [Dillenia turbinata]|uniref:Uncharacterized protein n=1 Tax=Dillenia turbinata TaxID=194707 RepID=A0AAN8ZQF3_9MAGN